MNDMSKVSKKELEGNIFYLLSICSGNDVIVEHDYIKFFDAGKCVCQISLRQAYRLSLYLLRYISLTI